MQLRNRLGLGRYDPGRAGRPVEIFLMRYTVDEVIAELAGQGHPAIPTVLDGDINPFFSRALSLGQGRKNSCPVAGRSI